MTPAILRTVLAFAIVFGIGIIANIFANQRDGAHDRMASAGGTPALRQETTLATAKLSREAEQRRVVDGVRRQLIDRGYLSAAVASVAGSSLAVHAAILAFEYDYHLALAATPTDAVLEALIFTHAKASKTPIGTPTTDVARKIIAEVQRALENLGYGGSHLSGKLDAETKQAISKFERARGLQVSGRISAPLIESLGPAVDRDALGAALAREEGRTAG